MDLFQISSMKTKDKDSPPRTPDQLHINKLSISNLDRSPSTRRKAEKETNCQERETSGTDSFQFIKVIGRGSYGKVCLLFYSFQLK